jgi:hypothetical protein
LRIVSLRSKPISSRPSPTTRNVKVVLLVCQPPALAKKCRPTFTAPLAMARSPASSEKGSSTVDCTWRGIRVAFCAASR